MRLPAMTGTIERRLLVNYRADPAAVAALLPAPLEPQLVRDSAVVDICLIRLAALRPLGLPAAVGFRSENAAHRIAVRWRDPKLGDRTGVYIPHRHSASRLTVGLGGRVFPGRHTRGRFQVREAQDRVGLTITTEVGPLVEVEARTTDTWPQSRLFAGLDEASTFFRQGCDGYSPARQGDALDGVRLETSDWSVVPAEPLHARSAVLDDPRVFPPGTLELDHALLMRQVPVVWHALPTIWCPVGERARLGAQRVRLEAP